MNDPIFLPNTIFISFTLEDYENVFSGFCTDLSISDLQNLMNGGTLLKHFLGSDELHEQSKLY
jgi:hypothetical protein